jgi:hypothetical protein
MSNDKISGNPVMTSAEVDTANDIVPIVDVSPVDASQRNKKITVAQLMALAPPAGVTSVSGSGGTTGLTLTGGPITSVGTLTLGGILAVANGGTGVTTVPTAAQITFSDGAKLVGDANLTWDATTGLLVKKVISSPYGAVGQLNERFGIGSGGSVTTFGGVAVGYGAVAGIASESTPTAIGALAQADSTGAIAIGGQSRASGTGNITVGSSASNLADHGILIGYSGSLASGLLYPIAIGSLHSISHEANCALGQKITSARVCELSFGAATSSPLAPSFRLGGALSNFGNAPVDVFRIGTEWIDAAYATRKARAKFYINDTAEREFLRVDSNGTTSPVSAFTGTVSCPQGTTLGEAFGASASIGTGALNCTVVGNGASAGAFSIANTVIGQGSSSTGDYATLVGQGITSTVSNVVAIGRANSISAQFSIAVGDSNTVSIAVAKVGAIGRSNTQSNQGGLILGRNGVSEGDYDMCFSWVVSGGDATNFRLQGSTTPVTARSLFRISTAWIDSADATRKSRAIFNVFDTAEREFMRADATGAVAVNVKFGSGGSLITQAAVLGNTATDGFLYIPTVAGVPTGVPTAQTGTVALQYDSTNNNLYVYNAAWKKVTLT